MKDEMCGMQGENTDVQRIFVENLIGKEQWADLDGGY
jgi:hypothetical protein